MSEKLNINTALLTVVIAVAAFVAHSSIETGKAVEAIKAAQVTRAEVETKLETVRSEYVKTQAQLADLSTRVSVIERTSQLPR